MIDKARAEARRTLDALLPHVRAGVPVVGLEPSCLLTLRDEFLTLLPGDDAQAAVGKRLSLRGIHRPRQRAGKLDLPLADTGQVARVHGHCHQKAAGVMGDMGHALSLIPGLDRRDIESSCCGMAGAFGYQAETIEVSRRWANCPCCPPSAPPTPTIC